MNDRLVLVGNRKPTKDRGSELGIDTVFAKALPGVRRTRVGIGVSAPSPASA